jgi:peptidoglycan/xylan/chitin deacetylase (PgdA/CDA1 family)
MYLAMNTARPAFEALLPPLPKLLRRWGRFLAIILGIAAVSVIWCNGFWPNRYVLPGLFGEGIYSVQTPEKLVALTFDDGPDPRYTEEISQILTQAGGKGTFFMIGKHAEQYPEIVQHLIAQGHEIGNHTWNHPSLRYKSVNRVRQELETTDRLLRDLGYQADIPFRSPYGHSLFSLPTVLKARHQANILWTVHLRDWEPASVEFMMNRLAATIKPGAIVLLHDADGTSRGADRSNTVEVVRQIVAHYGAEGYQFVTISELLQQGEAKQHRF